MARNDLRNGDALIASPNHKVYPMHNPSLLLLCAGLVACSESRQISAVAPNAAALQAESIATVEPKKATAPVNEPATETGPIRVTSAFVFVPQWEGANGFSAGGKYIVQGVGFNEDRSHLSDKQRIVGLPAKGGAAVAFEIVGASLKGDHVEMVAVDLAGHTFSGDDTELWVLHSHEKDGLSRAKLMDSIREQDRPKGEAHHQLNVAIDFNGDGRAEYAEFSHHCKQEQAPHPIDDQSREAWEQEHGPVDWDYTCNNVYTLRADQWVKGDRKTPM
jgi:hypothetical protein